MKLERKLVDTISFRTQSFFRRVVKKLAKFLFGTRYSILSRTIFELGTLELIGNLAKLTSKDREILVTEGYIFDLPDSLLVRVINKIASIMTNLPYLENKKSIDELWKVVYNITERLLDFSIERFPLELLESLKEEERFHISGNIKHKITKHLNFAQSEIDFLNKILWEGDINSAKVIKKLIDFSSKESLKLWLLVDIALLIKLAILVEQRQVDKRAFRIILDDIKNNFEVWSRNYSNL